MKKTYAFNSMNADRKYNADDIAYDKAIFYSDGIVVQGGNVLGTQLQVEHVTGMQVKVNDGIAIIKGRTITFEGEEDGSELVTLEPSDLTNNRIDRIVLELNLTDRDINLKSIQGTPASSPVAPTLTRNDLVYQISLAQIIVTANTSIVGTITDERSNSSVCGISNVTVGITPPTGNDAETITLTTETANLIDAENVDDALKSLYFHTKPSNLTLFKIPTVDATSGDIITDINFQIVGTVAPTTTTYTTNSKGYIYVLLPYGSYTLTLQPELIGYNLTPIVFSSVSGESYKELNPIFIRSTVKKYTMDTTKQYKKAPYITQIDAFLVGGGGGGGGGTSTSIYGGGGGGGYTTTALGIDVSAMLSFTPTIGSAGAGRNISGTGGGTTTFLENTAIGGNGGSTGSNNVGGGSGGSGGGTGMNTTGGTGGSNGGNGEGSNAGIGQGTTTTEFGEGIGDKYGAGGGGGSASTTKIGGATGGGTGGSSGGAGVTSATFYGSGGGGTRGSGTGGNGYKGCVVIRWA